MEPIKGEVELVTEDGSETVATRIALDATKIPLVKVDSDNDSQENTISTFSADVTDTPKKQSVEGDEEKSSKDEKGSEETTKEQDDNKSEKVATEDRKSTRLNSS